MGAIGICGGSPNEDVILCQKVIEAMLNLKSEP